MTTPRFAIRTRDFRWVWFDAEADAWVADADDPEARHLFPTEQEARERFAEVFPKPRPACAEPVLVPVGHNSRERFTRSEAMCDVLRGACDRALKDRDAQRARAEAERDQARAERDGFESGLRVSQGIVAAQRADLDAARARVAELEANHRETTRAWTAANQERGAFRAALTALRDELRTRAKVTEDGNVLQPYAGTSTGRKATRAGALREAAADIDAILAGNAPAVAPVVGAAELVDWHKVTDDTAFARPFGTVRQCRDCGALVGGGPTRCARCAQDAPPPPPAAPHSDGCVCLECVRQRGGWRLRGEPPPVEGGGR